MIVTNNVLLIISGILAGILVRRFTLSVRSVKGFCRRILPALQELKKFSRTLTNCLLKTEMYNQALINGKVQLEKALLERYSPYPEWIYKVGFNPGLRSGFRGFLIHLECIVELHFAIASNVFFHDNLKEGASEQSIAMSDDEVQKFKNDIHLLAQPIAMVMRQNEELIDVITLFCETHAVKELSGSDYLEDIKLLDEHVKSVVPQQLEMLDMSPSAVRIVSLVRDIKEVRQVLLQLLASLPA